MCYSVDGYNLPDEIPDDCDMVFVCETFEGEAYEYLHSRKLRYDEVTTLEDVLRFGILFSLL